MQIDTIPPGHSVVRDHGVANQSSRVSRVSCCNYTYRLHCRLSSLKRKYGANIDLVPYKPDAYKNMVNVKISRSLKDPHHFSHVPFEFCQ